MPNCLEYISRCPPLLYYIFITYCRYIQWNLASFPGAEEGKGESAWYTLFNYSKNHVVELGACTNMTINGSREQHNPS